jgi:hypothetical protein
MYLYSVQKIINRIGDENINKITVYRTPLSKALKILLNVTSMGQFEKKLGNSPYDTLYHLFMVIETNRGNYVIEKNEVIQIYKFSKLAKGSESLGVPITNPITLNDLLENTKMAMGDKFFTYKGQDNNCQYFINSILVSNKLNTDPLETFILQDVRGLFQNNEQFRKIVNTTTDVGAVASTKVDRITNELLRPASTAYNLYSGNLKYNSILNKTIPEFFKTGFSRLF